MSKRIAFMSLPAFKSICGFLGLLGLIGCDDTDTGGQVTHERLLAAGQEPSQWLSHGRDYAEQRFSPLEAINDATISDLGLAWAFDFPTRRGMEATPLVVDGVMYVTAAWNLVFALDAKTGQEIWSYDPEVSRSWVAKYACCDAVNRGVALWGDTVFVATLDGRLIALDAKTGALQWEVLTIDQDKPYTITGAPRVVKGKVLIGNSGADYGVRGYISAYDAVTGKPCLAVLYCARQSSRRL